MTELPPAQDKSELSRFTMFLLLVSTGGALYFMHTYTGPFQWLAEQQISWIGTSFTLPTYIATFVGLFAGMLLITFPFRPSKSPPMSGAEWLRKINTGWAIVFVIGLVGASIGAYECYRALSAGDLVTLDLARLEAGEKPVAHWVRISGHPIDSASILKPGDNGIIAVFDNDTDRFVPVVSGGSVKNVHLFLTVRKITRYSGNENYNGSFTGMIQPGGLPGTVRFAFEKAGAIHGDDYYLLDPREDPTGMLKTNRVILAIGVAIMIAGAIGVIARLRRRPTS